MTLTAEDALTRAEWLAASVRFLADSAAQGQALPDPTRSDAQNEKGSL